MAKNIQNILGTGKHDEVLKGLVYHHGAWARGYVSRKNPEGYAVPYEGKFGKGVAIHLPAYNSTRYHLVQYWVEVA